MDIISITAIVLTALGSLLGVFILRISRTRIAKKPTIGFESKDFKRLKKEEELSSGKMVLKIFAAVLLLFGLFSAFLYWEKLIEMKDLLFYGFWLFLFMVFGMFVQVISSNYKNGEKLLSVSASQLLYPLLFSVLVFYPIWVLGASATDSLFALYAAFLNGFFWETVVSNTKLPSGES